MASKFESGLDDKDTIVQEKVPGTRESRVSLYMAATVAAAGGFVVGFDTGAISGIMALDSFSSRFLNENAAYREGLLTALMLLTATIGGLMSGNICDWIGRKYTILLGAFVFGIGALFQTIGYNFGLLITGRLFVGFGEGFLTNAIPLYHSEIAPPDIRGRLISFFSAMCSIGTIVGYFVNFGTSYLSTTWSWRAPFLLEMLLCFSLSFTIFLPFSPRWLMDKGRSEEALLVLAKLHSAPIDSPNVMAEYRVIREEIESERAFGNRTYIELFRGSNLKRTLLALFTGNGAAFSGTSAISYFAPQIFQQAGLSNTSVALATSGGSNIVSFAFNMFALLFIDKVGRRPTFVSGAFIMGASMFICGAIFQSYTVINEGVVTGIDNTHARNAVIALVFIFQAAYAYSWGPVAYVYPAEVLNMRTRAKGLALAYGLNWAISIFMTFVMPIFMNNTIYGGYYFFGSCCALLLIGSCFLPETKGRTLEEIDRMFNSSK
ncbi:general substrate transporter [Basidiobolus meristosporus CBS 931.73]|uniref:General substrate transporter n=1 Tax=Basidiobolus meristosporus CBS 931.73 TaxID=1314790 RepID=A0A1Y1XXA7_9FUNG|nr:general substrate transporter [Basidiobolus meristosporus CBS 931.73]|eukprot:ORX90096.1 general substrate transporter [Basidiobolus meristosporus CBS 931.73]